MWATNSEENLIFLALAGVAVIGVYTFVEYGMTWDPGRQIPVAFGLPAGDTIQMHVAVSDSMVLTDPPRTAPGGRIFWKEWVDEHWMLRDASGERVTLARLGTSALFIDSIAAGAPECAVMGTLKQGEEYTLDFFPINEDSKQYRHRFTAPTKAKNTWRPQFDPYQGD